MMRVEVGKVKIQGLVVELKANQKVVIPEQVMLLRRGQSNTVDGLVYQVDDVAMNAMIQAFQENNLDVVIDYDHQSFKGDRAPAAGWIKDLEARKDGLWARVEWTPAGQEHIANKEYRYMSPVFWMDQETKRPVVLTNVALTNNPRIKDYPPIVNSLRGDGMNFLKRLIGIFKLAENASEEDVVQRINALQEANSAMKKAWDGLRQLVGLDDKAGMEQVANAVTSEVNKAKASGAGKVLIPNSVLSLLGLPETAGENEVTGAIQGLQAAGGENAKLAARVNTLETAAAKRDAAELVANGTKAGKIPTTDESQAWALDYAEKDPKGFQAYLNAAPVVVPVNPLGHGPAAGGAGSPDALQRQVNSMLGISDDDFKKYGPQAGEGA